MRNIYLIGLPGAGKTSIGRLLAKEIQRRFVDTDRLIAKRADMDIAAIFQAQGEAAFRRLEHEVLKDLTGRKNRIIATGGGIVLNPENIRLMRKSGRVIWLKRDPNIIIQSPRIKKRPLLAADKNKIFVLQKERGPLYRKAAHIIIENTEDREKTVKAILKAMRRHKKTGGGKGPKGGQSHVPFPGRQR